LCGIFHRWLNWTMYPDRFWWGWTQLPWHKTRYGVYLAFHNTPGPAFFWKTGVFIHK
jgi:hypothetical protein